MEVTDQEATLERFRLHELIGRYVDTLNHRDWERYADCWTEDCVFMMTIANDDAPAVDKMTTTQKPISVRTDGREGILGLVRNYNNYPWLFQIPAGITAELEDDGNAVIRHILQVNSHALYLIGICYDRVVRGGDGVWRIAHRDYRPSYFESRTAPGVLCRNMPDTAYLSLP